jgi:hypothetical protein
MKKLIDFLTYQSRPGRYKLWDKLFLSVTDIPINILTDPMCHFGCVRMSKVVIRFISRSLTEYEKIRKDQKLSPKKSKWLQIAWMDLAMLSRGQ